MFVEAVFQDGWTDVAFEALVARELPDAAVRELDAARFIYRPESQPQPLKEAA